MDGKPSTEEDPHIVKEQLFVISDDEVQDHAVHKVQELVKSYVEDTVEIRINKMHEFTDGCAAQYKSRNCVRDISCCLADFGFLIQRRFLKHHTPKVSRMLQGQILSSLAHSKAGREYERHREELKHIDIRIVIDYVMENWHPIREQWVLASKTNI